MARHEFGIIDQFEENRWYSEYEPDKYRCVEVSCKLFDQLFSGHLGELMQIDTFAVVSTQPFKGLDECGITLIPPRSLQAFRDVVHLANVTLQSPELELLITKVQEALEEGKHMIHFGI